MHTPTPTLFLRLRKSTFNQQLNYAPTQISHLIGQSLLLFNNGKKRVNRPWETYQTYMLYRSKNWKNIWKAEFQGVKNPITFWQNGCILWFVKKSVILPEWKKIKNKTYLRSFTVFIAHVQIVAVWSTGSVGATAGGTLGGFSILQGSKQGFGTIFATQGQSLSELSFRVDSSKLA